MASALVALAALGCAHPAERKTEPRAFAATVRIGAGMLEGAVSDGILSFQGVPFAAPPVGELRWRPPRPAAPWTGVRKAAGQGHGCLQAEDCLMLNVWRPAAGGPEDRLPVLVWIHGGGGSASAILSGGPLARLRLVVVTFNYRLGRLGFFAHPALLAAREGPAGNFGFMDQIAALRWVQANIGAFGGDPGRVTLAGESAGGASVLHLLTSPAARGLFHRAVVLSGGGRRGLAARPMAAAARSDAAFAESLGIRGKGPAALAALRALPAGTFVDGSFVGGAAGTPMIDGTTVTASPEEVFRRGGQARLPVIAGTTAQDLPLDFPPRADPFSYFKAYAGKAKVVFNPEGKPASSALHGIAADMTMHEPARFVARSVTAAGSPAWLYRFTYVAQAVPERRNGAAHAQELPYLFNTLDARYGATVSARDRQVARELGSYLAQFVRTGDPNGAGLPRWPRFDARRFDLMDFTLDDGPVFGADPRAARIALVERMADARR